MARKWCLPSKLLKFRLAIVIDVNGTCFAASVYDVCARNIENGWRWLANVTFFNFHLKMIISNLIRTHYRQWHFGGERVTNVNMVRTEKWWRKTPPTNDERPKIALAYWERPKLADEMCGVCVERACIYRRCDRNGREREGGRESGSQWVAKIDTKMLLISFGESSSGWQTLHSFRIRQKQNSGARCRGELFWYWKWLMSLKMKFDEQNALSICWQFIDFCSVRSGCQVPRVRMFFLECVRSMW